MSSSSNNSSSNQVSERVLSVFTFQKRPEPVDTLKCSPFRNSSNSSSSSRVLESDTRILNGQMHAVKVLVLKWIAIVKVRPTITLTFQTLQIQRMQQQQVWRLTANDSWEWARSPSKLSQRWNSL